MATRIRFEMKQPLKLLQKVTVIFFATTIKSLKIDGNQKSVTTFAQGLLKFETKIPILQTVETEFNPWG